MDKIASDNLTLAFFWLYKTVPYYYYLLHTLDRIQDKSIPTLGVGIDKKSKNPKIVLVYNPEFILSLTSEQLFAILQHEALHIVFEHLTRGESLEKHKANIAMDIVVNENIVNWKNLAGNLYSQFYSKESFDFTKTLDYSKVCFEEIYSKLPLQKSDNCNHRWDKLSSEQQKQVNEIIDRIIAKADKSIEGMDAGNISGAVRKLLDEKTAVIFNWKKQLSIFAQSIAQDTKLKTWKRINRKFPYIIAGNQKEYKANLLVVLDNSGSTMSVYPQFISHIAKISEYINIEVIGVDTRVNFEYTFKDGKIPDGFADLKSGGGTLFQPAFDYAKEKNKYNGIIYFTDGQNFDNGALNTFGAKTLFAICKGGKLMDGFRNIIIE